MLATETKVTTNKKRVVSYIDADWEIGLRVLAAKAGAKSLSEYIAIVLKEKLDEEAGK